MHARQGYAAVRGGDLFHREIGQGVPAIVLHGGPDFDHRYFLPELDLLSDVLRLIYYDQRGRGWSAPNALPETITMASEVADVDGIRGHFGLETVALLGHSWGALLALEYAIRHPQQVSHLLLMNPAPASHADLMTMRREWATRWGAEQDRKKLLAGTAAYRSGDPSADAEYHRVHYRAAVCRPEHVDLLVPRLRSGVTADGILRSRAIEDRLYEETWGRPDYDLLPQLARLEVATLVVHGADDFVPLTGVERVAEAIPACRLAVIEGSGHFTYLEQPEALHETVAESLGHQAANSRRPSQ